MQPRPVRSKGSAFGRIADAAAARSAAIVRLLIEARKLLQSLGVVNTKNTRFPVCKNIGMRAEFAGGNAGGFLLWVGNREKIKKQGAVPIHQGDL